MTDLAARLQEIHDLVEFDTKRHAYKVDGKPLDPVTRIIGSTLAKGKAFSGWIAKVTREGRNWREVSREEANKGKFVHRVMENWVLRRLGLPELPLLEAAAEAAYLAAGVSGFLDASALEPIAPPERRLYHPIYGYGGTLDLAAKWHGAHVIVDFKSCRRGDDWWDEWTLQSAAYRLALLAHDAGEWQGLIVRIPKDGSAPNLLPLGDDRRDYYAFVDLLRVYRWQRRDKPPEPHKARVIQATEGFLATKDECQHGGEGTLSWLMCPKNHYTGEGR